MPHTALSFTGERAAPEVLEKVNERLAIRVGCKRLLSGANRTAINSFNHSSYDAHKDAYDSRSVSDQR